MKKIFRKKIFRAWKLEPTSFNLGRPKARGSLGCRGPRPKLNMVSPKFWADEKNFRRKFLGPKFGPKIFAKIWRKFWPKFSRIFAKIFQTYKEKKSQKIRSIFCPEISGFPEISAKKSRPTKKKNLKKIRKSDRPFTRQNDLFWRQNDQIQGRQALNLPIFGPARGQKSRPTPDFLKIRRIFRAQKSLAIFFLAKIFALRKFS